MSKSFRLALVQMTSTENVEANIQMLLSALSEVSGEHCDLVCLPENAFYLRISSDRNKIVAFDLKEKFWQTIQVVVNKQNVNVLIGSVAYRKGQRVTNATVLISPRKKPKIVYEKIHLFDVDVKGAPPQRESEIFDAGRAPSVIKIKDWKIGLSICYDLRFAELYSKYARKNVDLILVPAAFLVPPGQAHWHTLLQARAIESQAYVGAAAQCGGHLDGSGRERATFGHSLVVDPWGKVLLDMGEAQGMKVSFIDLEIKRRDEVRAQIPMSQHRRSI